MKKILLISLFCCNFSNAISILGVDKDQREITVNLNLSGFSNVRIGYLKNNIIPKFFPDLKEDNIVALRNGKELMDEDFVTSDIILTGKVNSIIIEDRMKN